jgi:hypothetical protein
VPPVTHSRFTRRDFGRLLLWFLLQGLVIVSLFIILTLLGTISSFSIPWSLIAFAALLAVAYRHGHHLLVLGLGGAALAAQHAPAFFGYALVVTIPLYALLSWKINRPSSRYRPGATMAFWILLITAFPLLPWALHLFGHSHPSSWLWWHGLAAASLFILYAQLGLEKNSPLIRQGYFEHLGYLLFTPQRLAVLPLSPSWFGQHSRAAINLKSHLHAWKAIGLGGLKTLLFLLLTHLHAAPIGQEQISFWGAWWHLFLHYFTWLCWFQAHLDLAVALARILGIRLPILYNKPLAALSLISWWHRFNQLIPHIARKACVLFPNQNALQGSILVTLTYLFIPIGMIGSLFLLRDSMQLYGWLIFVAMISSGIGFELSHGTNLFQPRTHRGWKRVPYWIWTHGYLSVAHLFLLNRGYFSGDPIWNWKEHCTLLRALLPF